MTTTLIGDRQTAVPAPRHLDLDVAAVARMKGEIAALVAEMGQLAASASTPQAFYPAMLARLTTAMGGSGAALWQLHAEDDWNLLSSQTLASSLANGRHPSEAHLRILQRVAREKQPVLVPPGDIAAGEQYPINPLDQCLIYAPVPVDTQLGRYWLQVVQPPSGGVATQRGYLRFVSQIADLTADFLKTFRIRQFDREERFLALVRQLLNQQTAPRSPEDWANKLSLAIQSLTDADQVMLLSRPGPRKPWQLLAVSGLRDCHPRSPGVRCLLAAAPQFAMRAEEGTPWILKIPELPPSADEPASAPIAGYEPTVARLIEMFSLSQLGWLPLAGSHRRQPYGLGCLLSWSSSKNSCPALDDPSWLARAVELGRLHLQAAPTPKVRSLLRQLRRGQLSWIERLADLAGIRWIRPLLAALLTIAIGLIPVPLRIHAPATLLPAEEHYLYAPSDARIEQVFIDYGQRVEAGQLLLQLEAPQLTELYDDAVAEQLKSKERQRDIQTQLLRVDRLTPESRQELEGELETLRSLSEHEQRRIDLLQTQLDQLAVRAPGPAVVATWSPRQKLQDRPVQAGQLLLLLQQPEGDWLMHARFQQRDVGKFLQRLGEGAITASCALSSHPHQSLAAVLPANEIPMIKRLSVGSDQEPEFTVRFAVNRLDLPQQHAGSLAHVSVEIGHGPLAWSLFGDALLSLWTKVRLWI
jgi:multidrug efflux pump subunit AcrA (membrane-fusion protein)